MIRNGTAEVTERWLKYIFSVLVTRPVNTENMAPMCRARENTVTELAAGLLVPAPVLDRHMLLPQFSPSIATGKRLWGVPSSRIKR